MREDTITTKVYEFKELSDEAKEAAIQNLADINVDYEWWDAIYEDAKNVGIKITEFDIGRGSYCRGDFIFNAEDVAKKITEEHGEFCETYKTANGFLAEFNKGKREHELSPDYDSEYEEFVDTGLYDDIMNEFKRSILEDYRIMLEKEYEYFTSEEAIIETIEANKYEFTEDGKLY